jgi:hypothetical protein
MEEFDGSIDFSFMAVAMTIGSCCFEDPFLRGLYCFIFIGFMCSLGSFESLCDDSGTLYLFPISHEEDCKEICLDFLVSYICKFKLLRTLISNSSSAADSTRVYVTLRPCYIVSCLSLSLIRLTCKPGFSDSSGDFKSVCRPLLVMPSIDLGSSLTGSSNWKLGSCLPRFITKVLLTGLWRTTFTGESGAASSVSFWLVNRCTMFRRSGYEGRCSMF